MTDQERQAAIDEARRWCEVRVPRYGADGLASLKIGLVHRLLLAVEEWREEVEAAKKLYEERDAWIERVRKEMRAEVERLNSSITAEKQMRKDASDRASTLEEEVVRLREALGEVKEYLDSAHSYFHPLRDTTCICCRFQNKIDAALAGKGE